MVRRHGEAVYRDPRWKATRLAAKRRDGWRCVACGARGRLEVDHIEPIRHGGAAFDLGNLQTLCGVCHGRKTRVEVSGGREDPARDRWKELLSRGL